MLRSMTAYGRASLSTPLGCFVVEIQSVNRKYLEINVVLPREISRFETHIKKWIGAQIVRGSINIKITARFDKESPVAILPNIALAVQIKEALGSIAKATSIPFEPLCIQALINEPGLLVYEDKETHDSDYEMALKEVVDKALEPFIEMKEKEGATLLQDFDFRLDLVLTLLRSVEEHIPDAVNKLRIKLSQLLQELFQGASAENEEKVLREIALFATKVDVTEEIIRLKSHLEQAHTLLHSSQQGVGKTFEFLLQEMVREINTIGSKSADIHISKAVIAIKSELEKMREQIQNVE